MKIEWNPAKAANNPELHAGVTFTEASGVFLDPYALTREDSDAVGEQRLVSLGIGSESRLLVVVYTLRGENVRIISAWKANAMQRKSYEAQFR